MNPIWKFASFLLGIWILGVVYMTNNFHSASTVEETAKRKLDLVANELQLLREENDKLIRIIDEYKQGGDGEKSRLRLEESLNRARISVQSNPDREVLLRKVLNGAEELWYYIRANWRSDSGLVEHTGRQHRSLLADIHRLRSLDEQWRLSETRELQRIVEQRIHYLQNPADCRSARKLLCDLNKGCGYGCQLHHVVYCMIVAYATERTLILQSQGWRYSSGGWEKVFLPLSDSCTSTYGEAPVPWDSSMGTSQAAVVLLPIIDSLSPRPDYLPLAVPEDLSERLRRVHGNPAVWWVGQMAAYLSRPQPWLKSFLDETVEKMHFARPIVGVHVRRTDKVGLEASFHDISEYMVHVAEYYDFINRTQPLTVRRVFLASDDPQVFTDAQRRYPDYVFLSDEQASKSASLNTRYSDESLRGVILDIHLLSLTDFLVCTFSSQVCRVAYELMQTLHADASWRFRSLDDVYYFGGQQAHNMRAIEAHWPERDSEFPFSVGDQIGIAGNHWDGYSKGINRRVGKEGLFPSYKTVDDVRIARMPTYAEADRS